ALAMLAAEELDVPLAAVRIEQAPRDRIFGNVSSLADGLPFHPEDNGVIKRSAVWLTSKFASELGLNMTGGSPSVKDAWEPLRMAAATARAMLVGAAAKSWNVPVAECQSAEGFVTHGSGKRAGYGELAAQAAGIRPSEIRVKEAKDFRL